MSGLNMLSSSFSNLFEKISSGEGLETSDWMSFITTMLFALP
jgi:hypothetical protein